MNYIKQFLIILLISLIGEILKYFIPLPIPASIYGMVILLVCLLTHTIELSSVKETGHFLIDIMPIMFIPAGVGLITSFQTLKDLLVPVSIITVVTIITVIFSTGKVSQYMIEGRKNHD